MKTKLVRPVPVSILLAILLVLVSVVGVFAQTTPPLTPPGSVTQRSWDPSAGQNGKWTTGLNPGYAEGQTAVMSAEIVNEAGITRLLPICLQVWELPAPPTKAYGFTTFERFDTTKGRPNLPPVALPGDEPIDPLLPAPLWDTSHSFIVGHNITIESVGPLVAVPECSINEIGVVITYTPKTDSSAYILWGGHVAKAGDVLPTGAPDVTVPPDKSASFVNGNFQARLKTAEADKTLTFKVSGATAVTLTDLTAKSTALPASGAALIALVALAGVAGVVWTYRRAS